MFKGLWSSTKERRLLKHWSRKTRRWRRAIVLRRMRGIARKGRWRMSPMPTETECFKCTGEIILAWRAILSRMKKVWNFNILIRRVRRDAETGEEAEDETEDDVEQADIETQVNSSSTNNNWMFSFHSPGVGDPGGQSDRCTVPAGHRRQRGGREFY